MDAQKREVSQPQHQSNLKRPWLGPNDTFDARNPLVPDFKNHLNSRAPERAREHLRVGYLQGIISPEKHGSGGEPPIKKIRGSEYGLERHIFPRPYPLKDPSFHDRKSIIDPTPLSPQGASSQGSNKQSSSPPGDIGSIGSNGHASVRENGDQARQRQHKSLLITNSPNSLNGVRSNKASSESGGIRPANSLEKSHDMQLECNPLLQEVALGLSQLASILRTGKNPEAEVELLPKDDRGERSTCSVKCPDVAQIGLKETLRWMLNVIQKTTTTFVHPSDQENTTPPRSSPENERTAPATTSSHRPDELQGPLEVMKRRFLDDDFRRQHPDEETRRSQDSRDSSSRDSMQPRRSIVASGDELPPMRSQSPFSTAFSHTSLLNRPPAMNPPPAPNRSTPISPPGHQRLSPTTPYKLTSPAQNSVFTTQSSNAINLPSPRNLTSGSLNSFYHPISPPTSISVDATAAANAHTAALQHDVSIRTLALQSLQLEHNNLLAAFTRSQQRASTLEKKFIVSDTEINNLSEEKSRLQAQVAELEQTIEEISRSRDEARQSAVQDGAQYVQMIKMAGQLEERGREERKAWEKLKGEMEERIERLVKDVRERERHRIELQRQQPPQQQKTNTDNITDDSLKSDTRKKPEGSPTIPESAITPPSSAPVPNALEESQTSCPTSPNTDVVTALRNEIQMLRKKCAEFEQTLLAVRSESLEIEAVTAALEKAGRRIRKRVDESMLVDATVLSDESAMTDVSRKTHSPASEKQEVIDVVTSPNASSA